MKYKLKSLVVPVLLCCTLGMAPSYTNPHIVGKINWILGGAKGMGFIDYCDLLWHSLPWVWLIVVIIGFIKK